MNVNTGKAARHRAIAFVLAYMVGSAGIPIIVFGTGAAAGAVSPEWSVVAGLAAFFILLGVVGAVVSSILRWGREGRYRILFPGYGGKKFPAFMLLDGPDSWKRFQTDGTMMWLGDAPDCFFALRTTAPKKGREPSRERLLDVNRAPLTIPKSKIQSVEVIERRDDEIAASAVDQRDYVDRLGSAVAQQLTGIKVRTRIVPFAAYVVVGTPSTRLVFGVPTEVPDAILHKLTGEVTSHAVTDDPLVQSGIAAAQQQISEAATAEIGATQLGSVMTATAGQAMDIAGTASWWLNPDAAEVATARGDRGRLAAHLLAEALEPRRPDPIRNVA